MREAGAGAAASCWRPRARGQSKHMSVRPQPHGPLGHLLFNHRTNPTLTCFVTPITNSTMVSESSPRRERSEEDG